jgi:hypothetical protein
VRHEVELHMKARNGFAPPLNMPVDWIACGVQSLSRYAGWGEMALRVLVLLTVALMSQAWALSTPANPGVAQARLVFEKSNALLSRDQESALDRAAEDMVARCGPDWASRSWLRIEYSLAPSSLPRRDYQLIGARAERVREYMKRFTPKLSRVLIDISEGAFDNTANTGLDHSVLVTMMCSL